MSLICYIFFGMLMVYYLYFKFKYGKDIWKSAKGEDGKLQFVEAVGFIWLVAFGIILFADLMPGIQPSDDLYMLMNIIFVSTVAGSVTKEFKNGKKKDDSNSTKSTDK